MELKEIYSKITQNKIEGIMLHQQANKMLDFLGFIGLKSWQEHRYICESAELCSINSYIINHHNIMIDEEKPKDPDIIPVSWYNYNRYEVDNNTKQSAIKDFFSRWKTWEENTKNLYSKMYKECCDNGYISDAIKIKSLIRNVDIELMYIERKFIEYKSVNFDLDYIMHDQCDMYKKYSENNF